MNTSVIVLAAGRGQRMCSALPKVLHSLAGVPLLAHTLSTVKQLNLAQTLVVVGYKQELIQQEIQQIGKTAAAAEFAADQQQKLTFVTQPQQLGTGDAVRCAVSYLAATTERVLILNGDVPLLKPQTIQALLTNTPPHNVGLLTATVTEPQGLGRIVRDAKTQQVIAIVEEKDASAAIKAITEINPGVYVVPKAKLLRWLPQLKANNAQQELYITDLITLAISDGVAIHTEMVADPLEVQGVNTRAELAKLERELQWRIAEHYLAQGVTLADPHRFDVRGNVSAAIHNGAVKIAEDVCIDVNVILAGKIIIEANANIGANVYIKDSIIGAGTTIFPNSIIEGAVVGKYCKIGPFSRVRPDTKLGDHARLGNFVEVKNAEIGKASKANHLSYIGDAQIGEQVNIGAGTITCNYDGANKHKTIIGNDVFIGSDTQLVAPVAIGNGATIAAGTTILKDVPEGKLVLNSKQTKIIAEWQRPQKLQQKYQHSDQSDA